MPVLIELSTRGMRYMSVVPDVQLNPWLLDWLSKPSRPAQIIARWLFIHPDDHVTSCVALADHLSVMTPGTQSSWRRVVPEDARSNAYPTNSETIKQLSDLDLACCIHSGSVTVLSSHMVLMLARSTENPDIQSMLESGSIYRGVRFFMDGTTVHVQINRVPDRNLTEVLDSCTPRVRKKLLKEVRRVRTQVGGFPDRMNPGAYADALLMMRKQDTRNNNEVVLNWLRSARENSRRSPQSGRWDGESLEQYASRRFDRGTNPGSLPEKFSVPGELIGVEIEFVPPVNERDLVGTSFNYPVFFGADYTYDGSVKNYVNPDMETDNECRILLRHGHYLRVHRICDAMVSGGCTVNDTCGLHVHLDARDLTSTQALAGATRLRSALPLLAGFVSYTRFVGARADRYCKPEISPSQGDGDHYTPDRYYAVNLCALQDRGTVEVRMHHATLDPMVIEGWARLLRFLFRSTIPAPTTQEELLLCPGLADAMGPCFDYAKGPWNKFHAATMTNILESPIRGRLLRRDDEELRFPGDRDPGPTPPTQPAPSGSFSITEEQLRAAAAAYAIPSSDAVRAAWAAIRPLRDRPTRTPEWWEPELEQASEHEQTPEPIIQRPYVIDFETTPHNPTTNQ